MLCHVGYCAVVSSEVETSRREALRCFRGIPRLRFASLGMTRTGLLADVVRTERSANRTALMNSSSAR